jgi:type III restriction enzyme
VITFVNIGVGADARKFALQAVGRGVRIEPRKSQRRRLANLYNAGAVDASTFDQAKPYLSTVETLFIFGASRPALAAIFQGLEQEKFADAGSELALAVNQAALSADHPVLIPTYRRLDGELPVKQRSLHKFELAEPERQRLTAYVEYLGDDRVLLARHNLPPQQIGLLRGALAAPDAYFVDNGARRYGSIDILLPRLANYSPTTKRSPTSTISSACPAKSALSGNSPPMSKSRATFSCGATGGCSAAPMKPPTR